MQVKTSRGRPWLSEHRLRYFCSSGRPQPVQPDHALSRQSSGWEHSPWQRFVSVSGPSQGLSRTRRLAPRPLE